MLVGFKKVPVPQVSDGMRNALTIQLDAVVFLPSQVEPIYDILSNKVVLVLVLVLALVLVLVLEHFSLFETLYSEGIYSPTRLANYPTAHSDIQPGIDSSSLKIIDSDAFSVDRHCKTCYFHHQGTFSHVNILQFIIDIRHIYSFLHEDEQ